MTLIQQFRCCGAAFAVMACVTTAQASTTFFDGFAPGDGFLAGRFVSTANDVLGTGPDPTATDQD